MSKNASDINAVKEYARNEWLKYHPEDKDRDFSTITKDTVSDEEGEDVVVFFIIFMSLIIHAVGLFSGGIHSAWGYFFFPLNLALIKPILKTKVSKPVYWFTTVYFITAIILYIVMICLVWKDFFLAGTYMLNTWYCIFVMAVCISRAKGIAEQ